MSATASTIEVLCIGETLTDFVPDHEGHSYVPRPGGAPANVAAALASLGRRTSLVSAVGADWLGDAILTTLRTRGIDTRYVARAPTRATGLAVVAPRSVDDASGFLLYREASADAHFDLSSSAQTAISQSPILHLSSLLGASTSGERVRRQALSAISPSTLVSFDVNLRVSAWRDPASMLESATQMLERADIIKVTEDELDALGIVISPSRAGNNIWLVTNGGDGARLVTSRFEIHRDTPRVPVVDTTGAGDASLASLIDSILASPSFDSWSARDAERVLDQIIQIGTHVVQHSGAMCDLGEFAGRSPGLFDDCGASSSVDPGTPAELQAGL